ncbi:MAG TPA: hypothetical protein VEV62_01855 [Parafilimonas sp.]|nr:hypothetical protein [Parafilimonas sp.]
MKRLFIYASIFILSFAFFYSCQRGISPLSNSVSDGSLLKDNNGNCVLVSVSGAFIKGEQLNDSNYLEVSVNITSPGLYNITTDTVNGYFFKASGTFTSTGSVQIKLPAFGKPIVADTDFFSIRYNESFCEGSIIVTDTSLEPAEYALSSSSGNCMDDTVYGSYIKGIALDSNSKIKIEVNVISAGTYSITTSIINGYSFSTSGTFLQTGVQSIFLNAEGTPLNAQADEFDINTGTSSCSLSINVLTPLNIIGGDYYPLTKNSYWTYDDLVNTDDTIKETVIDSTNINNNFYKIMNEDVHFGGPYKYFYRKSDLDYFEYAAPNKYTTFFQYKKPVYADIPFLKENLNTNSTWQSPEYIDTTTDGNIIYLKYEFSCLNNNATITVNGKAFANVYEIKMLPKIKSSGNDYAYTNEQYLFYYAKGVGLIYLKKTLSGFIQQELQIRNWQVY